MYKSSISFFLLFLFAYLIGVLCYDYLWDTYGFSYTDEIIALCLLVFYLNHCFITHRFNKEFFYFLAISLFYFFYSLGFGVNGWEAVWMDFCIQIKSFLAFYVVYSLAPKFTMRQLRLINNLSKICFLMLLFIGFQGQEFIAHCFHHPSRYATAVTITGFLYLYSSGRTRFNVWVAMLIWSVGILSFRSKFYGFYACAAVLFLWVDIRKYIGLTVMKKILYGLGLSAIIIFAARDKISHYLIDGTADADNMFARVALYYKAPQIVVDYFPFGSGLGSYATFASGKFYSPLYGEYNMDHLYGMTPDTYEFIADTYFPVLVQFGFVGIGLYALFWLRNWRIALLGNGSKSNTVLVKMNILVFVFFFIESITDSTFTNNRGLFMMMLLALFLRESELKK